MGTVILILCVVRTNMTIKRAYAGPVRKQAMASDDSKRQICPIEF